jgi:acyl-CoA synthetase (AMP-forming)/AMP-acid ligase II
MGQSVTPISSLFTISLPDDQVVAFGAKGPIGWRTFTQDVASLAARISACSGRHWLVIEADAYALAVGVLATLQAECKPMLPANLQHGHLAELAATADGVVSSMGAPPGAKKFVSPFEPATSAEISVLGALARESAEIILHTSGTTGVPLAVHKPLHCFEAEIASATEAFLPDPSCATLATVPPYHIYGLIYRVLWPLATGRPFSADMISYPEELMAAVEEKSGAMLISSPAFLRRALPGLDLDHLKNLLGPVLSSGGPLPSPVAAAYNAVLSYPVFEVYGSTETGGIAFRSVTDAAAPELWRPLPTVEVKLDPEDEVLAIRSPLVAEDGWVLASDRVVLHEDGRFELKGRADRVVKIEEKRVSLPEVEQRLVDCPTVEAARVISLPGEDTKRQILGAVIEPTAEGWEQLAKAGKREVRESLREALNPYLTIVVLPRKWRFVTRMPEDERGKTSNAALVALFDDHCGRRIAPVIERRDSDPDKVTLHLQLPKNLIYFDGHFDEAPILAGVVQIDWAIEFATEHFALSETFQRIEALKFFKIVMAGDHVTLDLSYDRAIQRLKFQYYNGETIHSSGRVIFDATP